MKKKLYYILLLLIGSQSIIAQSSKNLSVCLKYYPNISRSVTRIFLHKQIFSFTAQDTCLTFSISSKKLQTFIIESEGYETIKYPVSPDTLQNGYTLKLNIFEKNQLLNEVVIKPESRVRYRGDTLVISLDDVEPPPQSTAGELLEYLAEASVINGKLLIMGKEIDHVLVDGKMIFGGDIKATLDVIKADMIKNLEVTEQYIGGKKIYVLNLFLNAGKKKGTYGEGRANIGTTDKKLFKANINKLTQHSFFNAFITKNNINEKVIDTERQNQIANKIFANNVRGGYSIIQEAEKTNQISNDGKHIQQDFTDFNQGLHENLSGGVSFNYSKDKKVDFYGLVIGEKSSSTIEKKSNTQMFLGETTQLFDNKIQQQTQRKLLSSTLNTAFYLDESNTLKLANGITFNSKLDVLNDNQAKKILSSNGGIIANNTIFDSKENTDAFSFNQKAILTHRFKRPAQVLSAYLAGYYDSDNRNKTYQNMFSNDYLQLVKNQNISYQSYQKSLETELVFDTPIFRKWLFESKLTYLTEDFLIDQQANNFSDKSGRYDSFIKSMSLDKYQINDEQKTVQGSLFHRLSNFKLIIGVSLWQFSSNRGFYENTMSQINKTVVNPHLFLEKRFGTDNKISFSLQQLQKTPYNRAILPIIDSTSFTNINIGNPLLTYTTIQKFELIYVNSKNNGNTLNINLKHEIQNEPIIPQINYSELGVTTFKYIQMGKQTNSEIRVNWSFLGRKKVSIVIDEIFGYTRQNFFIQNEFVENNALEIISYINLKYTISRFLTLKVSNQNSIYFQKSPTFNQESIRNELSITINGKIFNDFYTEVRSSWVLIANNVNTSSSLPMIDCQLSKFFFNKKNIKIFFNAKNSLNSNLNYYTFQNGNTLYEERTNRLSQFFMFGLSYYFTKW